MRTVRKNQIKTIYKFTYSFLRKIRYDHVSSFAGHAALFLLMSLFPMVLFCVSMFQYLPIHSDVFSSYILTVMPEGLTPLFEQVLQEAYKESTTIMVKSVTMLVMLFCASKGVYAMMIGINAVYGIRETRNIFVIYFLAIIYVIGLFAMLGLMMVLIVLGNNLFHGLIHFFPVLETFRGLFQYGKYLCMLVLLMIFFLTLYMTMPNRKSKLRYELPGAVFSTVAWLAFSWVFSFYISHFANFSLTYGSLATIIIFIYWMYGSMNIVFIGGEINVVLRTFVEYGYNYKNVYEYYKDEYEDDLLKGNVFELLKGNVFALFTRW
ncbi:MAG: YihY/virulence factor BrkB family protein [Lachnospiraceae bacterium]|nr:YihY/virulence factor BrkB family protein [Lachnospiraceae bacterium]